MSALRWCHRGVGR